MKIFFILFLLINVVYLGYEMDKQTLIRQKNVKLPSFKQGEELQLLNQQHRQLLKRQEVSDEKTISSPEQLTSEDIAEDSPISELIMPDVAIEAEDSDSKLLEMLQNGLSYREQEEEKNEAKNVCLTFGPFDLEERAQELMEWFKNRQYVLRQRWEYENEKQLFWVYLAPVAARSEALATLEQLQTQGVEDFRLIRKGSFKNAISLGLFSSQARVNRRLSELNSKGYRPVVVPYGDDKSKKILWLDVLFPNQQQFLEPIYQSVPARFNSLPMNCDQIDMAAAKP